MNIETILFWVSVVIVVGAFAKLASALIREAFPHKIVITDTDGEVLGELSVESVQHSDPDDLEQLHERIRRKRGHVRTRAAA